MYIQRKKRERWRGGETCKTHELKLVVSVLNPHQLLQQGSSTTNDQRMFAIFGMQCARREYLVVLGGFEAHLLLLLVAAYVEIEGEHMYTCLGQRLTYFPYLLTYHTYWLTHFQWVSK